MKGMKRLAAMALGIALLASVAPASAGAAAYKHYVACGSGKLTQSSKPSHSCLKSDTKGAFFESAQADVFYEVCVKFPTGKHICATKQEATMGTLYVNKITSNIPGEHKITWFVAGKRVGVFIIEVPE